MNPPSSKIRNVLVAVGVAAAVIPAAVSDAKTNKVKAPKTHKAHAVNYVFKGTFSAGKLTVVRGNKHVRRAGLVGTEVSFDFSSTRVKVADANGDGTRDMADVANGDKVVVTARLARRTPGAGPFAARRLVDQTHVSKAHAEDEDEDSDDDTADAVEQEKPETEQD